MYLLFHRFVCQRCWQEAAVGIQAASCFAGEAAGRASAPWALAGVSSGRAALPQPPAQPAGDRETGLLAVGHPL